MAGFFVGARSRRLTLSVLVLVCRGRWRGYVEIGPSLEAVVADPHPPEEAGIDGGMTGRDRDEEYGLRDDDHEIAFTGRESIPRLLAIQQAAHLHGSGPGHPERRADSCSVVDRHPEPEVAARKPVSVMHSQLMSQVPHVLVQQNQF
jgi:hypothetical protein